MAKAKKKNDKRDSDDGSKRPKLNLQSETKKGIAVILLLVLAGVTALAIINTAGALGGFLFKIFSMLFGVLAYLLPILLVAAAYLLFKDKNADEENPYPHIHLYVGMFLLIGAAAGLIHLWTLSDGESMMSLAGEGRAGGYLGALFAGPITSAFGNIAGALLLLGFLVIGGMVAFNISPLKWLKRDKGAVSTLPQAKPARSVDTDDDSEGSEDESPSKVVVPAKPIQQKVNIASNRDDEFAKMESITLEDRKDWKLPSFDLLDDTKNNIDSGNVESNMQVIKKTLANFGIEVTMGEVNVGPTVSQYTLAPAEGVRLSEIGGLQNDLALALAAKSIRLELPIPGQALVGIEVPNQQAAKVTIREVMQTKKFIDSKNKLLIALGRDVTGHPEVIDLASLPHMLIGGTTGSGKSVAINSLIISLLYRNTPQDLKMILVDPKQVELTPYIGIPHLLTPTIVDAEKAINALKWAVAEMQRRYKVLAEAGVKHINDYNKKTKLTMPFIVIVVDELANLMSVGKQDVETAISTLASLARAVGIHLVLATQRPSTEVVTGLIKANITTRVAFKLPSQIDSRTILDAQGAEKLLGHGDMLFKTGDANNPRRIQGAFVGPEEVSKVVDFFKAQAGAVIYNDEIIEKPKKALGLPGISGEADDDLYDTAKEIILTSGQASVSYLQRRLRVGHARAGRIMDLLEANGVVGPADGAKPREIYAVTDADRAEYGAEPDQRFDE